MMRGVRELISGRAGFGRIAPALLALAVLVPGSAAVRVGGDALHKVAAGEMRHTITPLALDKLPATAFGDVE